MLIPKKKLKIIFEPMSRGKIRFFREKSRKSPFSSSAQPASSLILTAFDSSVNSGQFKKKVSSGKFWNRSYGVLKFGTY